MTTPSPSPGSAPRRLPPSQRGFVAELQRFWTRVTEGLAINQLWSQFQAEARSSYRLYSREVRPYEPADARKDKAVHRAWDTAKQLFWAILMKLSPARRVILLAALAMVLIGRISFYKAENVQGEIELRTLGALLILLVLVLEMADRVTMKRDLEIAREIQSWLAPAGPPAVAQLDIAFVTRPANTVAGDYYDAFRRPAAEHKQDAPVVMIVADVAGKSIPAAMLMATLHASLHTLALRAGSVEELTAGLNQYCCEHSNGGRRFTTAFLAEFDPATCAVTSINAGHNAPVLVHGSGAMERLEAGGVPLGISTAMAYASERRSLSRDDVLFIFTDGLVEAENARQQEFGEPQLLPLLAAYRTLPAADMIQRVMQHVEAWVGDTPQHDDITCMVVKVK